MPIKTVGIRHTVHAEKKKGKEVKPTTSSSGEGVSSEKAVKVVPKEGEVDPNYYSDVHTILAWHAPGRPFQVRTKDFFINSLLIVMALEVILFLFSQYLLMVVIFSLAFLSFALAVTPPHTLYYRVSTEGIAMDEHFYLWQELYDFYFKERNGVPVLHVRTKAYFPGELIILPGDVPKDHLKKVLLAFLPYREVVRRTATEKAADWIVRSFPLEKPTSHHSS